MGPGAARGRGAAGKVPGGGRRSGAGAGGGVVNHESALPLYTGRVPRGAWATDRGAGAAGKGQGRQSAFDHACTHLRLRFRLVLRELRRARLLRFRQLFVQVSCNVGLVAPGCAVSGRRKSGRERSRAASTVTACSMLYVAGIKPWEKGIRPRASPHSARSG